MKSNCLKLLIVAMFSFFNLSFCQSSNEPRKLKVQLWVNGKIHPPNQTLTKQDSELKVKVFTHNEQSSKELAVTSFDVLLTRNGQKIGVVSLPGQGSIASLVDKAQNNDIYIIEMREIYEEQPDATLKKYIKGSVKVKYWFYDSSLGYNSYEPNSQIILTNN